MKKRNFVLILLVCITGVIVWNLSTSYATNEVETVNVDIIKVENEKLEEDAELINQISINNTTFNFSVLLPTKESKLEFELLVTNSGNKEAELVGIEKIGMSNDLLEYIDYSIVPLNAYLKTDKDNGSMLINNDVHRFKVTVNYSESATSNNIKDTLSLGGIINYK